MITIKTNDKKLFDYYKSNKSAGVIELIDNIKGYYITLQYKKDKIKINMESFLIVDNTKLNTIFINFTTGTACPSAIKGYCPFYEYCYSRADEALRTGVYNKNKLNTLFINNIMHNKDNYKIFINYCNEKKLSIRFNKDGDFRSQKDILFLNKVYNDINNKIFGGYTKRTDLIDGVNIDYPLNISGVNYKTTTDLKKYMELNKNELCTGYCNNCWSCYKHNNNKTALLHGAINKIDKIYNTPDNRQYIINVFDKIAGVKITNKDLTTNKGLLSSLNKYLRLINYKVDQVQIQFKNYMELIDFIKYMEC